MKEINVSIKIDGETHIITVDWTIFKKLVLQAVRTEEIERKIISSILADDDDDTSPGGTD